MGTLAGELVRQQKICGEWSEGVLVDCMEATPILRSETMLVPAAGPHETQGGLLDSDDDDAPSLYQVLPSTVASVSACISAGKPSSGRLHHVTGDVSKVSYGKGRKIIAHVCNDQ